MARTPKSKAEWRKTSIRVAGRFRFPIDMLRYDNCCPATECDSHRILESLEGLGNEEDIIVDLDHYTYDGGKATAARWESFGWKVIEDDGV